jgi:hypothetical protein
MNSANPITNGTTLPLVLNPLERGPHSTSPSQGRQIGSRKPVLPTVSWGNNPISVAPAETINSVAQSQEDIQATVAAENSLLRLLYGTVRVGGQIATVQVIGSDWVFLVVWGLGPINAIPTFQMNDAAPPAGVTWTHYLGTNSQAADATMAACISGYADTLLGKAYTVARVPSALISGFPSFAAIIQGRSVYDPRSGLTVYSDNPSLITADFAVSTEYGASRSVDYASVATCATANDALIAGVEKSRTLSLVIDSVAEAEDWLDVLRTYAGVFLSPEGAVLRFIPDATASVVYNASHASGNIQKLGALKGRDVLNSPTVMEVVFTDTSVTPYRDKSVYQYLSGVQAGTTDWRKSTVRLPGITRETQANREAIERLNKLTLTAIEFPITLFDDGLKLQVGDVIDVTHPVGLTAYQARIGRIEMNSDATWKLQCAKYDAAVYSASLATGSGGPNTNLPLPSAVAPVTSLVATERYYLERDVSADGLARGSIYQSRIELTWTPPVHLYPFEFRVVILDGAVVAQQATISASAFTSGALQQLRSYTVNVYVRNAYGYESVAASTTLTISGKTIPPLFPGGATLDGFEAGGEVFLSWPAASDTDTVRYGIRYGSTGGTWSAATPLDTVDGLRARMRGLPEGTFRFYVDAIDAQGNRSTTKLSVDLVITSDADAYLNSVVYSSPTLVDMIEYALRPDATRYWVTNVAADSVNAKFPLAMSTYTNPIATYRTGSTSKWTSEAFDLGVVITGNWIATVPYLDLGGTATVTMFISSDGTTYTPFVATSVRATGRFVKVEIASTGAFVLNGVPVVRAVAVGRKETSLGTVTSTGSGPKTITLNNKYLKVVRITVTPQGTAARNYVINNIVLSLVSANSFEVRIFDSSGAQVATDFTWDFEGL